ncbi:hypothetical protein EJ08DRAFT_661192 [Tothia fuscella]|uniref:Uncharacterized protein n=1 Tax=Tothia fuscella TaxID=1048955 RepID=A0A9P4TX47_9PEZI|nr:hypothetical protein EJ08DRAFT_661192 [Tothia fuscella]
MDEIGVILSILSTVKVLFGKDDLRSYRGARVKRTVVTAVEYISADNSKISLDFRTYKTLKILKYYFNNNIILYRLPSYISYKLQPCNIAVFTPLKAAYYDEVKRLERGGIGIIVLGKAKVISYKDLEEVRAKRAIKDAAKAKGKRKYSRKRKSPTLETDILEPKPKAA